MRVLTNTRVAIAVLFLPSLFGCGSSDTSGEPNLVLNNTAAITAVSTSGEPGDYMFSVTISSPDTGCEQFADWWEVSTADGTLLYRRILTHSHVDEQPFTRTGGPVAVLADDTIIVRAHMNNLGYGAQVFTGSISQGLDAQSLDIESAIDLSTLEPLPTGCAF